MAHFLLTCWTLKSRKFLKPQSSLSFSFCKELQTDSQLLARDRKGELVLFLVQERILIYKYLALLLYIFFANHIRCDLFESILIKIGDLFEDLYTPFFIRHYKRFLFLIQDDEYALYKHNLFLIRCRLLAWERLLRFPGKHLT